MSWAPHLITIMHLPVSSHGAHVCACVSTPPVSHVGAQLYAVHAPPHHDACDYGSVHTGLHPPSAHCACKFIHMHMLHVVHVPCYA